MLARLKRWKLDYHLPKAILNGCLSPFAGGKRRPVFFDVASTYPALSAVTGRYPVIRREFDRLLEEWEAFPEYHQLDKGEAKIAGSTPNRWSIFLLEVLGHRPALNRECCPETCKVLARVPNLIQAFFSILDPRKSIPEHEGPYLGYLRYHLALRVPTVRPPKLIVKSQDYVWKEGEAVLFDDSWPHSVVNDSPQMRAVLVIDVRRPLPWLPDLLNQFVTNVVARYTYGRQIARKAEAFAAGTRRIVERRRAA
jgi:aspartyl/asparaginyl beta-hydroxylase (cupin superfamily)